MTSMVAVQGGASEITIFYESYAAAIVLKAAASLRPAFLETHAFFFKALSEFQRSENEKLRHSF